MRERGSLTVRSSCYDLGMISARGFRNLGKSDRAVLVSKDGQVVVAQLTKGYWEVRHRGGVTRRIWGLDNALFEARDLSKRSEGWIRGARAGYAAAIDVATRYGNVAAANNVYDLKVESRKRNAEDYDRGYYRGYESAVEERRYADPVRDAMSGADLDREIEQIFAAHQAPS